MHVYACIVTGFIQCIIPNGIVSVDSKCSQASAKCGRVEDKSRPGLFDLLSAEEGS